MSFRKSVNLTPESRDSFAVELAFVVAALGGVSVWQFVVRESLSGVSQSLLQSAGVAVGGLVTGGVLLTGLVVYAGVYTSYRDIDVGLTRPSLSDSGMVLLAVVGPAALVGVTKLVGTYTGVLYGSLAKTGYGGDATLAAVLPLAVLQLVVGVPVLVLVAQVLVQGGFQRVVSGRPAVAATTATTAFVLLNVNRGLVVLPDRGRLVGAAVFVLLLGVALFAAERADRRLTRPLEYVPALGFAVFVAGAEVLSLGSVAGGVFVLAHILVLGIAAYTYERTGSIFVPALAYLSLLVSNDAVVFVFEAGL